MTNPLPHLRITTNKSNCLLGEKVTANIYFSNLSTDSSQIGFKGIIDVFIQKGLSNQNNQGYVGIWSYTNDEENHPIHGTGAWIDSQGKKITTHPYHGLTLPSDPNGDSNGKKHSKTKDYLRYSDSLYPHITC